MFVERILPPSQAQYGALPYQQIEPSYYRSNRFQPVPGQNGPPPYFSTLPLYSSLPPYQPQIFPMPPPQFQFYGYANKPAEPYRTMPTDPVKRWKRDIRFVSLIRNCCLKPATCTPHDYIEVDRFCDK